MTSVVSGAQIAAARALTGVSQAKLALRAGLAVEALQALEGAGHAPLDATPAIGPERLSIMFIMSDSLNTDSKLIFCFHLQFEIEAENDRRREAVTRGTLARSPGRRCPPQAPA